MNPQQTQHSKKDIHDEEPSAATPQPELGFVSRKDAKAAKK
jgi:hypothetical protein